MIALLLVQELGFRVAEYPSHHTKRVKVAFHSACELGFPVTEYYPAQIVIGHNCISALLTIVQQGGLESSFTLPMSLISRLLTNTLGNSTLDNQPIFDRNAIGERLRE